MYTVLCPPGPGSTTAAAADTGLPGNAAPCQGGQACQVLLVHAAHLLACTAACSVRNCPRHWLPQLRRRSSPLSWETDSHRRPSMVSALNRCSSSEADTLLAT